MALFVGGFSNRPVTPTPASFVLTSFDFAPRFWYL